MVLLLAACAFSVSAQLGWRAGTPEPVLDGDPDFIRMYWKSWELYQSTVVEDIRSGIPPRYSAPNGQVRFDDAIAHALYAKWAVKSAPVESTLRFAVGRIDATGAAPKSVSVDTLEGVPEAAGVPILPLAIRDVCAISGNAELARDLFASAARRNAYLKAAYCELIPADAAAGRKESKRYRVPRPFSCAPQVRDDPSIGDTAEALGLLFLDSYEMRMLAKLAGNDGAATVYDSIANEFRSSLLKTWNDKLKWFAASSKDETAVEPLLLAPFWSAITAQISDKACAASKTLMNKDRFGRWLQFPTISASEPEFDGAGGVSPLDEYLTLRALLESGQRFLAGYCAENMLKGYLRAAGSDLILYSAYGSDTRDKAPFALSNSLDAGLITIAGLIEAVLGFQVDAEKKQVRWNVFRLDRHGIKNLRFGDNVVTLIAAQRDSRAGIPEITVEAEQPFKLLLTVGERTFSKQFGAGSSVWQPGQ